MIVFGSVVYSEALEHLDKFLDSINKQIYKKFDILIINDNIDSATLQQRLKKIVFNNISIIDETQSSKTPAQLRILLLLEAKKRGYDLLILGDCDDTFSKNRVYNIKECYLKNKEYAFYYNDLILQNGELAIQDMPDWTCSIDDILQYNYLGLSNSAINMNKLCLDWIMSLKECESFVFDWYLFSRMLIMDLQGMHVKGAYTIYRIHQGNFVGLNRCNKEMIAKELVVKKQHYKSLQKYSKKMRHIYEEIKDMTVDDVRLSTVSTSFWWSNIRLKEEK